MPGGLIHFYFLFFLSFLVGLKWPAAPQFRGSALPPIYTIGEGMHFSLGKARNECKCSMQGGCVYVCRDPCWGIVRVVCKCSRHCVYLFVHLSRCRVSVYIALHSIKVHISYFSFSQFNNLKWPIMENVKQKNNVDVHVTRWNVRGLRKLTKLKKVLNRIKHLKSKIWPLQTHIIWPKDGQARFSMPLITPMHVV